MRIRIKNIFLFAFLIISYILEISVDYLFGDNDYAISHPLVYYPLNLLRILVVLILFNRLISSPKLAKLVTNWVPENTFSNVNTPEFVSIFRILHGMVCLVLAVRYIDYIPFKFYGSDIPNSLYEIFYISWIIILIPIIAGTSWRLLYFLSFIFSAYLLGDDIGCKMLIVGAFWSIFILPKGRWFVNVPKLWFLGLANSENYSPRWSVWLLALNLNFVIFTAGVYKLFDPFWFNGIGFYFTYSHPWIKVPWTDFLLDYEWVMISMNYLGIAFESLCLPFFLFRKTRWISSLFVFCFLILVMFPLRIDPVSQGGLCLWICALSLYNFKSPFFSKENKPINATSLYGVNNYLPIVLLFISYNIVSVSYLASVNLKPPVILYPFEPTESSRPERNDIFIFDNRFKLFEFYNIFNFETFLCRSFYTVDVISNRTEVHQPLSVYNQDGTINPNGPRGGFLKPLVLHEIYNGIANAYHTIVINGTIDSLSARQLRLLESLAEFNIHKSMISSDNISKVGISIYPIVLPDKYEGNVKFDYTKYKLELVYIPNTNVFEIQKFPEKVIDFEKKLNRFIPNTKVIFNP